MKVLGASRKQLLRSKRAGVALIIVVVLVMLIALGAYRYSFVMESEYRVTRVNEEQVQANLASMSGLEVAASTLERSLADRQMLGGVFDNAEWFRQTVEQDEKSVSASGFGEKEQQSQWKFGLISPQLFGGESKPTTLAAARPIPSLSSSSSRDGSPPALGLDEADRSWRWGLENESAKIHIPTLIRWDRERPGSAKQTLLRLPGVNEQWIDSWLTELGISSTQVGSFGSSSLADSRYSPLDNPLLRRESEDRIRFLWFGGDLNQNYKLDSIEEQLSRTLIQAGGSSGLSTIQDSKELTPLRNFLTWQSGIRNENWNGNPRIDLNQPNLQILHQQLSTLWPAPWVNFVIAARQYGLKSNPIAPSSTTSNSSRRIRRRSASSAPPNNVPQGSVPQGSSTPIMASEWVPTWDQPGTFRIASILDLVDATVDLTPTPSGPPPPPNGPQNPSSNSKKTLRSPFSSDINEVRNYLGKMLDEASVSAEPYQVGRIDVSEAPIEVLLAIPGIDSAIAQRIVDQQNTQKSASPIPATKTLPSRSMTSQSTTTTSSDEATNSTIAWLVVKGCMTVGQLRQTEPYIASRSDVYSVQSIGFRDSRTPVYRCTAIIDARTLPATIKNHQIWHPWDKGFSIDALNDTLP